MLFVGFEVSVRGSTRSLCWIFNETGRSFPAFRHPFSLDKLGGLGAWRFISRGGSDLPLSRVVRALILASTDKPLDGEQEVFRDRKRAFH